MSDLFRQQTAEAWEQGRWSAVRPVVWYAAQDIFTEALPAALGSQRLMAAATSLVCTSATFWCLLWALSNPLAAKAIGDRLERVFWHQSTQVSHSQHLSRR